MDLQTLRFFRAVCREGGFLAASRKLNYAQPNLSSRIAQLEKELGCALLIRGKNGATPTEKGLILLDYAEKILRLTEEAETAVLSGRSSRKSLDIGSMESSAITFLPALLEAFHRDCPEARLSVHTGTSAATIRKVLDYELDGSFVSGGTEHAELASAFVKTETLVLVADRSLENAPMAELLRRPLVVFPYGCSYRHVLEELLAKENVTPTRFIDITSIGALISGISAGLGIGLVPEAAIAAFSAAGTLSVRQVPEPFRTAEIKFVYRKSSEGDALLNRFIATMGGTSANTGEEADGADAEVAARPPASPRRRSRGKKGGDHA